MHGQRRLALAFLLLGSLHSAVGQDALPVGAKARLGGGGVLSGALGGEKISSASLSLDGKFIVAATGLQQALFDPATGKEVRKLESDPQGAFHGGMLAVAPNSKRVVGLDYQSIRIWDAATGKVNHKIPHNENGGNTPTTLSFSADGKTLAIALITYNQKRAATISIWNIEAGKKLQTIDSIHDLQIQVALSADAKQVASWGRALNNNGGAITNVQSLRIHAADDGKELKQIEVEQDVIRNAAFAPDGKSIVVATGVSTYHVYSTETGKEIRRFAGRRAVQGVIQFSPDGKLLAVGETGGAQLWNAVTGDRVAQVDLPVGRVLSIGFPAPGKAIVFGMHGQSYYLADLAPGAASIEMPGHHHPVNALTFSADGKQIVSASADGKIIWWNLDSNKESRSVAIHDVDAPRSAVVSVRVGIALSPSAKYFAIGGDIGSLSAQIWDLDTRRILCEVDGGRAVHQHGLAFSSDGGKFAINGANQTAAIWDIKKSRAVVQLGEPPAGNKNNVIYANDRVRLALSPDGKFAAFSSQYHDRNGGNRLVEEYILWDAVTGQELRRDKQPKQPVNSTSTGVAFSPDSAIVACAMQGVVLLNSATGKELRQLEGGLATSPSDILFSPDGRAVAVATSTNEIVTVKIAANAFTSRYEQRSDLRIFETATGMLRFKLPGHKAPINCLAFSPDGKTIASGGADTTVLLWDMAPFVAKEAAAPTPDEAWRILAEQDAVKAWAIIRRLSASPDEAIRVLRGRIKPDPGSKIDPKLIDKLVADLAAEVFVVRDKAHQALERLGELAQPALLAALKSDPPLELRRRADNLLSKLKPGVFTSDEIRNLRALEILERAGTNEARELIAEVAAGAPGRFTRDAESALKRLKSRQ